MGNKKSLRTELLILLNSHEILNCESKTCSTCQRISEIGRLLSRDDKYVITNRLGDELFFNNKTQLSRYLRVGNKRVDDALRTGEEIKNYTINGLGC